MPQLQWLGNLDKGKNNSSQLAEAIGGGISSGLGAYAQTKEKAKENAFKQEELDIKKDQAKHDWAKLDYDKRKDMYDTMIRVLPNVPADKQMELTSSPEWVELEKSLGMPSLANTTMSSESKVGWSNEQKVASVRADIIRGRVGAKRDMYGISEPKILDSEEAILDHISDEGLDPAMFSDVISQRFGNTNAPTTEAKVKGKSSSVTGYTTSEKSPYKEYPDAFKEGGKWKVMRNGKKYIVQE